MAMLIIGGTGKIGSLVVQGLAEQGAVAQVLTTRPDRCELPAGMTPVKGDLLDPAALRQAMRGIDSLFLLCAVSPSELTQALIALDLAHEANVDHIVYFSQSTLDWPDCPHAVAKAGAEALIRGHELPATILRPAYFFQNDAALKDAVLGGTYPIPIGGIRADMIDARDIADVAVRALLDRDSFRAEPVVELVGPDTITGERAAEIWSEAIGRSVAYGGDRLDAAFEYQLANDMPGWQAHDLVAMLGDASARECELSRRVRSVGEPARSSAAHVRGLCRRYRPEMERCVMASSSSMASAVDSCSSEDVCNQRRFRPGVFYHG